MFTAPDVFGPNGANYTNVSPQYDMATFGIDIIKKGDGKGDTDTKCLDGKWAKVSYKGYLKNGLKVYDTDEEGGDLIFAVGAAQTFKCFDLALPQMKPGAVAKLSCPANLVNGGASLQSPLGGEWIPENSDMDFEVEVKFCNRNPGQYSNMYWDTDLVFDPSPIKSGKCYQIASVNPHRSKGKTGKIQMKTSYWGTYVGFSYDEPTSENADDFKFEIEDGLDGVKGTKSFIPWILKSQGVNLSKSYCGLRPVVAAGGYKALSSFNIEKVGD